jgi:hypothetical protein
VFNLSPIVLTAAILWILACLIWFAIVVRRGFGPLSLYCNTRPPGGRAFWGGSGVLIISLTLIAFQSAVRRRRTNPAIAPPPRYGVP